jgi:hypothetical protein
MLNRLRRPPVPSDEWPLPRERVFQLLRNRRRQRVIVHLAAERETTFEALVDRIATEESEADEDRRDTVYASLYQTHLPMLVNARIVERDADGARARITERGMWPHSYLVAAGPHPLLRRAFLAESVLWTALSAAAVAGVPVVRAIPLELLLLGCLGTSFGTALARRRLLS